MKMIFSMLTYIHIHIIFFESGEEYEYINGFIATYFFFIYNNYILLPNLAMYSKMNILVMII
jgi:hypothetical protein